MAISSVINLFLKGQMEPSSISIFIGELSLRRVSFHFVFTNLKKINGFDLSDKQCSLSFVSEFPLLYCLLKCWQLQLTERIEVQPGFSSNSASFAATGFY